MKRIAVILCLVAIAAYAQTVGLKDVYANKFRFGTILNQTTVSQSAMTDIVKKEFNSITPENELKPDATITCSGSTNTDVKVSLQRAKSILDFCQTNNIPVRGHTLVWHSQTPVCFFKDNFTDGGNWVTDTSIMNKRMESYIKNMFAALKKDYPNLNLYAYDVVNEAAKQSNAGPRDAGDNSTGDGSMWVRVYKNNSFIKNAFKYARLYAPPTTKLFYNDFNEYMSEKRNYIADSIVGPNFRDGNLDGMGMQSHIDVRQGGTQAWPSASEYGQAVKKYKDIGVEIQITEIDATLPEGNQSGWNNWTGQAVYYKEIMDAVLTQGGDAVTAFVVWGIKDSDSWRKAKRPLLWDSTGAKKPAYDSLYKRIPQSQWGNGDNVGNAGGVHKLNISIKPAGSGNVIRNPSRSLYAPTEEVTLTPNPNIGWKFISWSGDITGTQASPKITMSAEKSVTANFELSSGNDYNLIQNGNFNGESNWMLNKWSESAGSITTSGGKATIAMTTAPSDGKAYNFQLVQNGISLITGYTYRLSFDASAASARTIGLDVQMDVDPWTTYFGKDVSLTTTSQTFEYEFEMTEPTDENGRIAFNIGGATPTVTLSNIRLVYAAAPAPGEDPGPGEDPDPSSSSNEEAEPTSSSSGESENDPSSSSSDNSNSPIRMLSSIPGAAFQVRAMSDGSLLIDANSPTTVEIYDLKGNKAAKFNVLRGLQKVNLSLPSGMYFAKARGAKVTKFMLK